MGRNVRLGLVWLGEVRFGQLLFVLGKIGQFKVRQISKKILFLKLSEMTADLAEEHSTATLATERLEAEQSERMRLEKEKGDLEVISI